MKNEWLSDLEIIDHLELLNSTVETAKWLNTSQSSCSRRYRNFSDECDLGFARYESHYKATKNIDILADLRKAAQGIRVRSGKLRVIRGWQLGQEYLNSVESFGKELPLRPMNTMQILTMIEERLVDIAITGVLECKNLMENNFNKLKLSKTAIGIRLMCVPICKWNLQLIAKEDHDLVGKNEINKQDLEGYPSLGMPLGTAPILMGSLNQHNLGTHPRNLTNYREDDWEGYCSTGASLSYTAPFLVPSLSHRRGLKALNYSLDITECLAVVGHRDVVLDPCFNDYLKSLHIDLAHHLSKATKDVQWLS